MCYLLINMKLTIEQIEKINTLILRSLKDKKLLKMKADEGEVLLKMNEIFTANLRSEVELDQEVEKIMEANSGEIDAGRLDYRRMFNMIKNKLAKERDIII
ncbi:MAG: DUF507 family protein [Deltaproteobacteria bacterium]|nr:DUF507 family protein [Deltaproteobacteria bacterium]